MDELASAWRPFSPEQLAARVAAIPVISYPDLPVSARRDEIAEAIANHQVVIVAGETGSGKTTQLPKICLELGRGITGMIGHTQPRRIAARSVADRIAEELGQKVGKAPGQVVGYQVQFTDEVGPTTLVKLMTDGILLAEIQSDPLLRRYDTLVIDEAHERSLNIDFILGYLAQLLPMRPDLKVIITSATIDSERFAAHFGSWHGIPGRARLIEPAPVIEVSGRTFPVEVRYRPLAPDRPTTWSSGPSARSGNAPDGATPPSTSPALVHDENPGALHFEQLVLEDPDEDLPTLGYGLGEEIDVETAICHAVDELCAEDPHGAEGSGDILVFLPGERDIREVEQALADHLKGRGIELLPLFARLSAAEQQRVFEPHGGRRIVLATNVAETSLTVPGIRYVIDPGLARISRYSNRTKVQRLPIEPVSRASANQRAGRCGRVADGIAIRLYSQADYEARPAFTEPEILRTSLASVILQMAALGLGAVADFPFLDAPDARAVRDGVQLLVEIGALAVEEGGHRLTRLGRDLARLPIDPRLGRMLLEADANGCASEVLVIVAALSIQDVRERPLEHQEAADAAHARFVDPRSDFVTYLNLWRYLTVQQRDLSGAAFRRMCRSEFLHYLRFREWRDVVGQLRQMARPLDLVLEPIGVPSPAQVAEMAHTGGIADAAARAAVAYTASAFSVDADEIHRSLLVGLLSNLGSWDEAKREYQGARGTRFTIWPGSGLARSHPAWVMTAELVETSRLFARTVARIEPEWIEPAARALVKRVYSDPFWSTSKGAAMVKEKVLLYGMTLVADRPVLLGSLGDTVIDEGGAPRGSVVRRGSLAAMAQGLVSQEASGAVGSHHTEAARALVEAFAQATAEGGIWDGGDDLRAPSVLATATRAAEVSPAPSTAPDDPTAEAGPTAPPKPGAPDPHASSPSPLTACELARDMLIRHGLVYGEWRERHRFQTRNAELLEQAREVERRSRRHGLVADEQALVAFFDDVIPEDITSAARFNQWWKQERHTHPDLLTYPESVLLPRGRGEGADGFPDHWRSGDLELPLTYSFAPGSARDGVTMSIPVEVLARVSDEGTDWLVPGMLEELVTEAVRALPKAKRRLLAPAPEVGALAAKWMQDTDFGRHIDEAASAAPDGRGLSGRGATTEPAEDPMSLSAAMDRLAAWGARTGRASASQSTVARPAANALPASSTQPAAHDMPEAHASRPEGSGPEHSNSEYMGPEHSGPGTRRPFDAVFADAIRHLRGVDLDASDLAHMHSHLPDHLRMTFVVHDRAGRELGGGPDLVHLQTTLASTADEAIRTAVRSAVAEAFDEARRRTKKTARHSPADGSNRATAVSSGGTSRVNQATPRPAAEQIRADLHQDGLTAFPTDALPVSVDSTDGSMVLRGYPALVPQGNAAGPKAGVRVMASGAEAQRCHREGLAHLLLARLALATKRVTTRWTGRQALMLVATSYPNAEALVADAQLASALSLVDELSGSGGPSTVRDAEAFETLARRARNLHEDRVHEIMGHIVRAMEADAELASAMRAHGQASLAEVREDVSAVRAELVGPGFLTRIPVDRLAHVARYVRAGAVRLERVSASVGALERDLADMDRVHDLEEEANRAREEAARRPFDPRRAADLEEVRWLIHELRVSLFAQQLGTPVKVSAKRVASALARAR